MLKNEVFRYTSTRQILSAALQEKRRLNSKFSVRSWSRQLGYKNPSTLAAVLSGKRKLKVDFARKISNSLKLLPKQQKYFECLALYENAKTSIEKEYYADHLKLMNPRQPTLMEIEMFRILADWYHFAILEMAALKNFRLTPTEIAARLDSKVTPTEAALALERLEKLGFLSRNQEGVLKRTETNSLKINNHDRNEAIQKHHRQMIEWALRSLNEEDYQNRDMMGSSVALSRKGYEKALDVINRCHREIVQLAEDEGAEEVFQLNTQFFKLTNSKKIKETSQ